MKQLHCLLAPLLLALCGCASLHHPTGRAGHLLMIGGGLDDDLRPVYERFIALASRPGKPRLVVITTALMSAASQQHEAIDKTEALRAWAPGVPVEVVKHETPTDQTVAAIDHATGVLFTGGDQAFITQRYRPGGKETPEWRALRRLLARGGVIAGGSAGDAMMGEIMLLSGNSADALAEAKHGGVAPQLSPGLGFLPWAITDSHFFERNRIGRLVVALEAAGQRLGIGVGEDAAVEVDLASGVVTGVTGADSLLVDTATMQRSGQTRFAVRARLIRQGDRLCLPRRLSSTSRASVAKPAGPLNVVQVTGPGQNRELALWRVFMGASRPGSGSWQALFPGWQITAWSDDRGEVIFEVSPSFE